MPDGNEQSIQISISSVSLSGDLDIPDGTQGVVLFAHGSGSGRHSPRNRYVAKVLQEAGVGTLLFDLLTEDEELIDEQTLHIRFDIGLLADRLVGATFLVLDILEPAPVLLQQWWPQQKGQILLRQLYRVVAVLI
jgi:hypothetical protein